MLAPKLSSYFSLLYVILKLFYIIFQDIIYFCDLKKLKKTFVI